MAASAEEAGDDIFLPGPAPSLVASMECIVGALQRTFGETADIMTDMPGVVSATLLNGHDLSAADVFLDVANDVQGLSTTLRLGLNGDGVPAPQGTAYLDYTHNGDIGYDLVGGLNSSGLEALTRRLDQELRSCAGVPAPVLLVG